MVLKKTSEQIMDCFVVVFKESLFHDTNLASSSPSKVSQVLAALGAYLKQLGQSFLCSSALAQRA